MTPCPVFRSLVRTAAAAEVDKPRCSGTQACGKGGIRKRGGSVAGLPLARLFSCDQACSCGAST
jgi:hypothetical protein